MRTILTGLLGVAGLGACDGGIFGDCADTVKQEVPSPDGRYLAVFERDCGATTDYSTHISLREAGERFDPSTEGRVLTVAGRVPVDVEWSTEEVLSVSLPAAGTFAKLDDWRDVTIVYR